MLATALDREGPACNQQWKKIDTGKFLERLRTHLPGQLRDTEASTLDEALDKTIATLESAIETAVPSERISPRSIPGFNDACKEACRETQRLRRIWQNSRTEADWEAYKQGRNAKGKMIQRTLRDYHRTSVEEVAGKADRFWKLARWAKNRGTNN